MSALDVVQIPGYPGKWARRVVVEAWIAAGRPYVNWAGRTYEEQKRLYNLWKAGKGNAADNPDLSWTRVPHVRGMALDLAGYSKARMEAAGFVQPIWRSTGFSQDEPWHWELKRYVNRIHDIPKVTASVAGNATPLEDDMTPNESKQLNSIYEAIFNGGSSMEDGRRSISASLADIVQKVGPINRDGEKVSLRQEVADAKTTALKLTAQVSALTNLVEQIASGTAQIDMGAVEAAAERGARDALAGLVLTATVDGE